MSTPHRTQASRSEATRTALIAAARRFFVDRGYAATGTPELVAEAQVTRGALYHHFKDKSDLLMAVALQMANEVANAVASSTPATHSALEALRSGSQAYFAAMAEGGRARVLMLDAPAVLSATQLTLLSEAAGAQELRQGLQACLSAGRNAPMDELASLLSAAFDRAARAVAEGKDPTEWTHAMDLLIGAVAAELAR